MSRELRTVTHRDLIRIDAAVARLADVHDYLRSAGAHNAANYVARALKSAHGARNHARRCYDAQVPRGGAA